MRAMTARTCINGQSHMIVYCEECGFKNTIDENRIKGKRPRIPCEQCGEFLRFYGLAEKPPKTAATPEAKKNASSSGLILKYANVVVFVDANRPRVEIGRQKSNDIQVVNNKVSRVHAIIEYRDGEYFLTDQSSNGTYLLLEGRRPTTVKKKSVPLSGKGVIGPGYKVDLKSPDAIHLRFVNSRLTPLLLAGQKDG